MSGFKLHFIDVGNGSTTILEYETEESGMVIHVAIMRGDSSKASICVNPYS